MKQAAKHWAVVSHEVYKATKLLVPIKQSAKHWAVVSHQVCKATKLLVPMKQAAKHRTVVSHQVYKFRSPMKKHCIELCLIQRRKALFMNGLQLKGRQTKLVSLYNTNVRFCDKFHRTQPLSRPIRHESIRGIGTGATILYLKIMIP